MNWMLVMLAPVQGAGRDTLLQPVCNILGIHNVQTIDVETLFGQFNDWLLSELVTFSEADSAEHNRWKVYKALKAYVAAPPPTVSVNAKFIPRKEHVKVANFVMLTNDPAAVAMDRGDRRTCVVESPYQLETVLRYAQTGVFPRLHAMYRDPEWMRLFHRFLLDREISESFDALGRAPGTPATDRMYRRARSGLQAYLEDAIEDAEGPFAEDLVKTEDLLPSVAGVINDINKHTLAPVLERVGARRMREFKDAAGKNVRNVWALRRTEMYEAMTPGELRAAWESRWAKEAKRAQKY